MEIIGNLLSELWGVWTEMFGILRELVKRLFVFLIWILLGIIILPCVFVAGNWYPKWTDWGEKL